MRRVLKVIAASSLCGVLASCAGGSLKRIEDSAVLPTELQKDLGNFEVTESAAPPAPQQQATPSSVPAKSVRASRKPKAPIGFAYPNRRPQQDPIRVGEKTVYDISYLGMTAGEFSIAVEPFKEINKRVVYHVRGRARSSSVFSVFYKLDDLIESFIDYEGIFPHRFHILLDESKQKRNSLELYDPEKARTFFWNRWDHHKRGYTEVKDFFPMQPLSQDSLSSLFYLRTLPLRDGDVATFPVVSEGKNWDAVVTVLRRETINTPMGPMKTVVLKPETKYQGILKKQGDSYIWISDDDRRVMVRLEAKVRIGSIVASLKSFEPGVVQRSAPGAPAAARIPDEALPPAARPGASSVVPKEK